MKEETIPLSVVKAIFFDEKAHVLYKTVSFLISTCQTKVHKNKSITTFPESLVWRENALAYCTVAGIRYATVLKFGKQIPIQKYKALHD